MSEKGITLVELLVTIAILGILLSFVSKMMISGDKVKQKELIVQKMDNSLGRTMDIIKRVARSSRTTGSSIMSTTGTVSQFNVLTTITSVTNGSLNLMSVDGSQMVSFNYSTTNKAIYVGTDDNDIIGSNIESVRYSYAPATSSQEVGILRITIKMRIKSGYEKNGYIERTVTDAVMSRVYVSD